MQRPRVQPFFYMNFLYVRCVSPKLNSRTLKQPNRHLISQRAILIYFSAKLEMVARLRGHDRLLVFYRAVCVQTGLFSPKFGCNEVLIANKRA